MRKFFTSFSTLLVLLAGALGVCLILYTWHLPPFATSAQTTNDAYVRGQVTVIAPQVSGYVADVAVSDYQHVEAGELIARIDDRIPRQKLAQAEAALAAQKAALDNSEQNRRSAEAKQGAAEAAVASARAAADTAEANFARVRPLANQGYVPGSDLDVATRGKVQAQAALDQAQASAEVSRQDLQTVIVGRQSLEAAVAGAEASVELARIDLSNTRIVAPVGGHLGEVGVRLGQYVQPGTQLVSVVPDTIWVVANFKENQISDLRIGQVVSFTVDAMGGRRMTGQIERFAPATGSEFAVLRPDNATGNFTKVAQRLPVRISIDKDQPGLDMLAPGMSVVVTARPDQSPVDEADANP